MNESGRGKIRRSRIAKIDYGGDKHQCEATFHEFGKLHCGWHNHILLRIPWWCLSTSEAAVPELKPLLGSSRAFLENHAYWDYSSSQVVENTKHHKIIKASAHPCSHSIKQNVCYGLVCLNLRKEESNSADTRQRWPKDVERLLGQELQRQITWFNSIWNWGKKQKDEKAWHLQFREQARIVLADSVWVFAWAT